MRLAQVTLGGGRACAWLALGLALAPILALVVKAVPGVLAGHLGWGLADELATTLALACGSALLAAAWGTGSAWLVEVCAFPGRRLAGFALFLPFALPPYLLAYVGADIVDDGGWLPPGVGLRNLPGACLVMSLALYPYVYMFARASFAHRPGGMFAAARLLGCGPWGAFLRVALPLARPAIAMGALLVFMETANDIAVAEDYGLGTLGYHVYDLWLNRDRPDAAAAVAVLLLLLALVLAVGESVSRRRQRQFRQGQSRHRSDRVLVLAGWRAWLATAWCVALFGAAFAGPVAYLVRRATLASDLAWRATWTAVGDTLVLVGTVLVLAYAVGAALAWLDQRGGWSATWARLATVGYAFPGVVYALGMLAAAAGLADLLATWPGWEIRALWISSIALLALALACRFVVIAWGAIEAGRAHVPPRLVAVARTAGRGRLATLCTVHLPLMRAALLAGMLLLAVDVLKELPLTAILRPFGTDTLALQVFSFAADEDLGNAAPAALALIVLASVALALAYRWVAPGAAAEDARHSR